MNPHGVKIHQLCAKCTALVPSLDSFLIKQPANILVKRLILILRCLHVLQCKGAVLFYVQKILLLFPVFAVAPDQESCLTDDYKNRNIRIKFLGDRTALDPKLQKMMNELEGDSACKTGMTLNIAINYGGRPEIVRAAQQLAAKAVAGEIRPEDINEQMMSDAMYTAGQKDPDFILRPSGEKRLSNFMLWQAAYSELVEMDVLWPDFTRADLDTAIEEFNHRSRRFGGI